jgi:hypothetical protein
LIMDLASPYSLALYATKAEEWQLHSELRRLWGALEAFNRSLTSRD